MKKIISVLLTFVISCTTIIVCAENSQTCDIPPYDYSSFVGEWHKIDPDGLNGDVLLKIMNVTGNKEILFSIDNGGEIIGTIQDNQVRWTEEWYDGSIDLTLTFYDDHIHLQYSRCTIEWYPEITFVSDRIKPCRIEIGDYSVVLNGAKLEFDQQPVMCGDRVLVPIRKIFEAMGYTVNWYEDKQTAYAVREDSAVALKPGNKTIAYIKNDIKSTYECDVPPQLISDRILVPVRAVSEISGCIVDWNGDTQTVIISAKYNTEAEITKNML